MTMGTSDDLDALLSAWARTVRIDDAEAAAVRQSITRTPTAPSPTWWRDFGTQIGNVVVRASSAGRLAPASPRLPDNLSVAQPAIAG
ncbi:MAG: hypothetical protein ACRDMV_03100 [Streptosporangiales bacterium]